MASIIMRQYFVCVSPRPPITRRSFGYACLTQRLTGRPTATYNTDSAAVPSRRCRMQIADHNTPCNTRASRQQSHTIARAPRALGVAKRVLIQYISSIMSGVCRVPTESDRSLSLSAAGQSRMYLATRPFIQITCSFNAIVIGFTSGVYL